MLGTDPGIFCMPSMFYYWATNLYWDRPLFHLAQCWLLRLAAAVCRPWSFILLATWKTFVEDAGDWIPTVCCTISSVTRDVKGWRGDGPEQIWGEGRTGFFYGDQVGWFPVLQWKKERENLGAKLEENSSYAIFALSKLWLLHLYPALPPRSSK